jgi:uncharacterized protein (UPF0332 family)
MSLMQWHKNGWTRKHQTSRKEISSLFAIVDRSLKDAAGDISFDARFAIAYNAALQLCTILLYAEGYQTEKARKHYYSIQAMSLILGEERKKDAKYLDTCRNKRNIVEYDYAGSITEDDVNELIEYIQELRQDVADWLNENHPELA